MAQDDIYGYMAKVTQPYLSIKTILSHSTIYNHSTLFNHKNHPKPFNHL